jgi:hypothetical protein
MWTRDVAASIGVTVPLHACEHYYVLFKDVPGLTLTCRCCAITITAATSSTTPANCWWARSSRMRVPGARTALRRISPSARSPAISALRTRALDAMRRVPALEKAGIQKFFCGPESFTPDVRYHLGESTNSSELLRRGRPQFHRPAIGRRHRQGRFRMDPRRSSAGRSMGSRCPAQHAVPDQSQIPARAGLGKPGAAVRHALALPPVRNGARRAQVRAARPPGQGRRLFRRSLRLGARQLVRAGRRRARSTNTVTAGRTGSSTARANTTRCATASAFSISPRSPNFASKAATPSACSIACAPTMSTWRPAKSSTPNG